MKNPSDASHMPHSPQSPDKMIVTSNAADASTGWIVAMIQDNRDHILALFDAHIVASDRRLQALEQHVVKLNESSDGQDSAIAAFSANIETNRDANRTLQESFGARLTAHTNFNIETAMKVAALTAGLEAYKSETVALFGGLRDQMSAAILAQKEVITAAFLAQKAAVEKAEAASEKRFEGVNEFRSTLADQQRTLMPRSEVEVLFNALKEKVDANATAILEFNSAKGGLKEGWGLAVGLIGIIMTILLLVDLGSRLLKP